MERANFIILMFVLIAGLTIVAARPQSQPPNSPSERFFDLSGLFNRYQQRPIYPGGGGIYQSGAYYPSGGGGYQNGFGGMGTNYPSGTNMLGGGGFGGGFGNGFGNSFGYGNGGYGGYGGFW